MAWAVAITAPQAETKVAKDIADLGFTTFCPKLRTSIIKHGRRVYRDQPLFRRYVMVRMCEAIYELMHLRHVSGFIRKTNADQSSGLALASDEVVNEIKSRCTGDDHLILPKQSKFIVGQNVRPRSGALSDHVGVFDGIRLDNQESALFSMMGRSVSVSFRQGVLIAA